MLIAKLCLKRLVLGCWISVFWRSDNFATEQSVIFTLLPFYFLHVFFIAGAWVFDLFLIIIFNFFSFFCVFWCLVIGVSAVLFCVPLLIPLHANPTADYKLARCGFILLTDCESCHTHNTETMTYTHPLLFFPISIVSVNFSSFSSSLLYRLFTLAL